MPLVPMEFHLPQSPISQPHGGDPLHFTPSSPSIQLAQRLKNSNACASRDDLDLRDRANDRELHSANLLPSRAEERTLYPLKLIDRTKKAPPRTPLASTTGCAPECPTEGPATCDLRLQTKIRQCCPRRASTPPIQRACATPAASRSANRSSAASGAAETSRPPLVWGSTKIS